jgi:hypothetical protein
VRIGVTWLKAGILKLRWIGKEFKKEGIPKCLERSMLNTTKMFGNEKVERGICMQ